MSDIVLGVGASHTTLMNTRWDAVDHLDRAHAFRDALGEAKTRLTAAKPDLVVIVGSNHFRGFWLDLMPSFTIGVGDVIAAGEHGTPQGPQVVDPTAALALCSDILEQNFDAAFSTELHVDHGISHAIQYLVSADVPVVPVIINAFAPPLPSLQRTVGFGGALGEAIRRLEGNRRVAIIGTGGLSHSLPFPDWRSPVSDDDEFLVDSWKNGRKDWSAYEQRRRQIIVNSPPEINADFDQEFLDALTSNGADEFVANLGDDDLVGVAGNGGNEIRAWLVACAAMGHFSGEVLAYSAMPEWLTGMAVATFEPTTIRNLQEHAT